MQILFDESEEQGPCPGLGVIAGRVELMRPTDRRIKVPHIGWNQIAFHRADPLLAGITEGAYLYFDHSYHAVPTDRSLIALDTDHGVRLTAAVRSDNVFACQFHPEKSQHVGLQILRNFVDRA
jgi:glutamine amidotransferase